MFAFNIDAIYRQLLIPLTWKGYNPTILLGTVKHRSPTSPENSQRQRYKNGSWLPVATQLGPEKVTITWGGEMSGELPLMDKCFQLACGQANPLCVCECV